MKKKRRCNVAPIRVRCEKCGHHFDSRGIGKHRKGCKGTAEQLIEQGHAKPCPPKANEGDVIVTAEVKLEINLTQALALGIARIEERMA